MVLSNSELESIYLARLITGGTSLICCLLVLLVYFSFKELHFFFMRLIMFMISSDALYSLSTLIIGKDGAACYISAAMAQFGSLSGITWAFMISIALYIGVVKQNREIENKTLYFCMVGYGFPVVLTILPAIFDLYGLAGGWCWVSTSNNFELGNTFRIVCYYGPLAIILVSVCVLYCKIIYTVRNLLQGFVSENNSQNFTYRFMVYPLILMFCNTPVAVLRVRQFFGQDNSEYVLTMIAIVTLMCTGIFNAIAYGFNGNVKQAIRNYFRVRRSRSISLSARLSMNRYSDIYSTF